MKIFDRIEPIFNLDKEIKKEIDSINNKLKGIKINDRQKRKYIVSKSKVRSVHSSLSIEANSLSLFDVESVASNEEVFGKKDDIQEVKNAIVLYSSINKYNYKSESDFLKAKNIMMKYFDRDNGGYRNHGEGIKRDNQIIYVAPESIMVPSLMKSLFDYIDRSDINLLVLAAVFHYYFVAIHPLSDGNGRMARFWMSLMLINYDNSFEFVPVEEEIYLNQEEYYNSIDKCHNNGNANIFIKFILKMINSSLDKVIKNNTYILSETQEKIIELITSDNYITQDEIVDYLNISIRTVKRNFKSLIDENIIERVGSDKTGYWNVINKKRR